MDTVKTKKEFTKKVLAMQHPIMKSTSDLSRELLDMSLVVYDRENTRNRFQTPGVKLLQKEYSSRDIDHYHERERKLRIKYENWLYQVCGNYCTVKS
jgi:hypothetical protein